MSQGNSSWREQASEAFGLPRAAEALKTKGFPKAAVALLKIVDELKKSTKPPDTQWRTDSMLSFAFAFSEDFGDKSEATRDFRRDCMQDVTACFLSSVAVQSSSFTDENIKQIEAVTEYFSKQIGKVARSLDPVVDLINEMLVKGIRSSKLTEKDRTILFHLVAYVFLVLIEGVLDDLARLFYFHKTIAEKREILNVQQLKEKTIRIITAKLATLPIFLHNWDARVYMRNAIGHATAYYDAEKDSINFVSWNQLTQREDFNEVVPLSDFLIGFLETWDALEAFVFSKDLVVICYVLSYLGGF